MGKFSHVVFKLSFSPTKPNKPEVSVASIQGVQWAGDCPCPIIDQLFRHHQSYESGSLNHLITAALVRNIDITFSCKLFRVTQHAF